MEVVTLKEAKEGIRYIKHLISGKLGNMRGCNMDIAKIISEYAKEHPEILQLKAHEKSSLTLSQLLDMAERDGNAITEIMVKESE